MYWWWQIPNSLDAGVRFRHNGTELNLNINVSNPTSIPGYSFNDFSSIYIPEEKFLKF